jgi:hypothetical protein
MAAEDKGCYKYPISVGGLNVASEMVRRVVEVGHSKKVAGVG